MNNYMARQSPCLLPATLRCGRPKVLKLIGLVTGCLILASCGAEPSEAAMSSRDTVSKLGIFSNDSSLNSINVDEGDWLKDSDLFRIWGTKYVFNAPNDLANLSESWTNDSKYHRLAPLINDRIYGVIRVGRDIYTGNIYSIENLNETDEKNIWINEMSGTGSPVDNFDFQKIDIRGRKFAKIKFTTSMPIEGLDNWTCLVYRTLFVNALGEEYVISFHLFTPSENFPSDREILESIIFSIRDDSERPIDSTIKQSGPRRFKVPLIENYAYFENSPLSNYGTIYDMTGAGCSPIEVDILDAIIPKNYWEYDKYPIINIHTFKTLADKTVTKTLFEEYRKEWLENLGDGTVDEILRGDYPMSSYCLSIKNELNLKNFAVLANTDSMCSYILFVASSDGNHQIIQTDHLLIDETVIFIRYNIKNESMDNLETFLAVNKSYSKLFTKFNSK